MELVHPLLALFASLDLVLMIAAGIAFGLIGGLIPGISGRIGLLIALPFAIGMDPFAGAVFLVVMHAVVHTTGSVPAILLGLPTSGSEAATVLDGYPLMRRGEGGRAVGALLMASSLGGVIGALALIALVPLARMLIQLFGSAEVAALSAAGLFTIAALAGRSLALGLGVAALGVLASSVGLDDLTGQQRYTQGRLGLWGGLNIAAVVAGFFVLPEMLRASTAPGQALGAIRVSYGQVLAGCIATLRHWWLTLRCAVLGIVVGFIPGLGASVVVWLAYGHASATTRPDHPYGQGAIAGVIAPEAANNSKEGGALAPTLMFAVPGTSSMGILLGAFAVIGVEVGPNLVRNNPGFIQSMGWLVLIANLIALPLCLLIAPTLTRFASMRRAVVLPFAVMAATTAALSLSGSVETLAQLIIFGALGVAFAHLNWPRAPFVLGFVIGPVLEHALSRTIMVQGPEALGRPVVLGICALVALGLIAPHLRRMRRAGQPPPDPAHAPGQTDLPRALLPLQVGLLLVFMLAGWTATGFRQPGAYMPVLACTVGALAMLWSILSHRTLAPNDRPLRLNGALSWPYAAYLGLVPLVGPALGAAIFAALVYRALRALSWRGLALAMAGFGSFGYFLAGEPRVMGRPVTALLDLLGL